MDGWMEVFTKVDDGFYENAENIALETEVDDIYIVNTLHGR